MIGWTKTRKRCPTHGLVLRGHPGEYSGTADYCPACGERLAVVSVPYLFQIYFHPAIAIVPGILIFAFGLFMFLDVRGCVIEDRKTNAIAETVRAELRDRVMGSMPSEWETVYSGMESAAYQSNRWKMLSNHLSEEGKTMPFLSGDQIRVFLNMLGSERKDDAFALITNCIEKGK